MSVNFVDNIQATNPKPLFEWERHPNGDGTYRDWLSTAEVISFFSGPGMDISWATNKKFIINGQLFLYDGSSFILIGNAVNDILAEATPTTDPTLVTGYNATKFQKFSINNDPSNAGTYTHFIDNTSTAIAITTTDLGNGKVELWGIGGVWQKNITPIVLTGYLNKSTDLQNDLTGGTAGQKALDGAVGNLLQQKSTLKADGVAAGLADSGGSALTIQDLDTNKASIIPFKSNVLYTQNKAGAIFGVTGGGTVAQATNTFPISGDMQAQFSNNTQSPATLVLPNIPLGVTTDFLFSFWIDTSTFTPPAGTGNFILIMMKFLTSSGAGISNPVLYITKTQLQTLGSTSSTGIITFKTVAVNGNYSNVQVILNATSPASTAYVQPNIEITTSPATALTVNFAGFLATNDNNYIDGSIEYPQYTIDQKIQNNSDNIPLGSAIVVNDSRKSNLFSQVNNSPSLIIPAVSASRATVTFSLVKEPPSSLLPFGSYITEYVVPNGQSNGFGSINQTITSSDNFILGAWVRISAFAYCSSGFYIQSFGGTVLNNNLIISAANLFIGYTFSSGVITTKVLNIIDGWAYISVYNNAPLPTGITTLVVNFYQGNIGSSTAPFYFDWTGITLLLNSTSINPLLIYSDVFTSGNSVVAGKTGKFDGDSITANNNWVLKFQGLTGCIIGLNQAVSGTTYAIRSGVTNSIFERSSSLTNADFIIVWGGTNDYGLNVPLGDINTLNDNTQFYSAVYNSFKTYVTNNPTTPILAVLTTQRNYQGTDTVRDQANAAGFKLSQYVQAIAEVAALFAIPTCNLHDKSGITFENIMSFTIDGLHPFLTEGINRVAGLIANEVNESFIL